MLPGMTVSAARLHGVSPSLQDQWRSRVPEGGQKPVRADEEVVPISRVQELEHFAYKLECPFGRKTMKTEILRKALTHARRKNIRGACPCRHRQVPGESFKLVIRAPFAPQSTAPRET